MSAARPAVVSRLLRGLSASLERTGDNACRGGGLRGSAARGLSQQCKQLKDGDDAVTRLERFLKARKIKPAHLATESGYSRQHLLRIRTGAMEPTRRCIVAVVRAVSKLSKTTVRPEELFVLSEDGLLEEQLEVSTKAAAEQKRLVASAQKLVTKLEQEEVPFTKWLPIIEAKSGPSEAMAMALFERGRELTFADARRAVQVHRVAAAVAGKLPRDAASAVSLHGRAHMGRGNALANLSDYPAAFAAFDEAELILTESAYCVRELGQVWFSRARTFVRQTAYVDAMQWTRRARVIFDAARDVRMAALARLLEGAILYETGNPADAEQLLRTTLDPLERVQDRASLAFVWLDIGRCNIDLGEAKTARTWLDKARSAFVKLGMRSEVVRADWCLAWLRALHEDVRGGLALLYTARRAFEELGLLSEAALVGLDIVEVLLLNDLEGAAAQAAQVCRAIIESFERRGETASARRAIAHLREAVQRGAADQNTVRDVKRYLQRWSTNPNAVFEPAQSN